MAIAAIACRTMDRVDDDQRDPKGSFRAFAESHTGQLTLCKVLTEEQLKAGIYIDYEGRPYHAPVLLGTEKIRIEMLRGKLCLQSRQNQRHHRLPSSVVRRTVGARELRQLRFNAVVMAAITCRTLDRVDDDQREPRAWLQYLPSPTRAALVNCKVLTEEQLKGAIYIDYEGRPSHDPVLLGTLEGTEHFGFIVDSRYRSFEDRWGARPSKAMTIELLRLV